MSLPIQKAVFNIITTILILGGYTLYVFYFNHDVNMTKIHEAQFWGKFLLVLIGVTIVFKIALYILFAIIRKIKYDDEDIDFMDEYDKLIEMRSERNGNHVFGLGLIASMIPLAMGEPIYLMFIILISSGFVSGILGDLWKIYYYKKGI